MTPTPECIESVARAILGTYHEDWQRENDWTECKDEATAAIAAATPFIRQALFDELIANISSPGNAEDGLFEFWDGGMFEFSYREEVLDWLRSQKDDDQ